MTTRAAILEAGFETIERAGFEAATVAAICKAAGVSNGSFFHAFPSKDALAAELFLTALKAYHVAMVEALRDDPDAARGVAALVGAHLDWVVSERRAARFIFERPRAEWMTYIREAQRVENADFVAAIEAWRGPLTAKGAMRDLPASLFMAQIVGPAQIFCRAWLSGRVDEDPQAHAKGLIDCAVRALVAEGTLRAPAGC